MLPLIRRVVKRDSNRGYSTPVDYKGLFVEGARFPGIHKSPQGLTELLVLVKPQKTHPPQTNFTERELSRSFLNAHSTCSNLLNQKLVSCLETTPKP